MPLDLLRRSIYDAAELGFEVLSVSGGEPLLYPGLAKLLNDARHSGMSGTFVTNGSLVSKRKSTTAIEAADLIGVSIDGLEENHNLIRKSSRSWRVATEAVRYLSLLGKRTVVVMAATRRNFQDLEALAEIAHQLGASALHVHPLEMSGRAAESRDCPPLTGDDKHRLVILCFLLSHRYGGSFRVECDLVHDSWLDENPRNFFLETPSNEVGAAEIGVMVLRADGYFSPIVYNLSPDLFLGNLATVDLRSAMVRLNKDVFPTILRIARAIADERAQLSGDSRFFNWYEELERQSTELKTANRKNFASQPGDKHP